MTATKDYVPSPNAFLPSRARMIAIHLSIFGGTIKDSRANAMRVVASLPVIRSPPIGNFTVFRHFPARVPGTFPGSGNHNAQGVEYRELKTPGIKKQASSRRECLAYVSRPVLAIPCGAS